MIVVQQNLLKLSFYSRFNRYFTEDVDAYRFEYLDQLRIIIANGDLMIMQIIPRNH